MAEPLHVPQMDARAIVERDQQVLIVRCRPEDPYPGFWTFPGGAVEAGRSPEASLRKWLRERLGVWVEVLVGQPPFLFEVLGRSITFRYYLCGIVRGEPDTRWWPEVQWIRRVQLLEYDFEPPARRVAEWLAEAAP